jgi:hypothetical protein
VEVVLQMEGVKVSLVMLGGVGVAKEENGWWMVL